MSFKLFLLIFIICCVVFSLFWLFFYLAYTVFLSPMVAADIHRAITNFHHLEP